MWAALVFTLSLKPIILGTGVVCALIGLWPAGAFRQVCFLVGCVTLSATLFLGGLSYSSSGGSLPPVRPVDPIVVDASFEKNVLARFDGSTAEAQVIAAICDQYAASLAFDGTRSTPKIANSRDLGANWAELQRYRGASERPWGERFGPLKEYMADQLSQKGIISPEGKTTKLTETTRSNAVQLYRDLATALLKVNR